MATQTLDAQGNVVQDGYSTNLSPAQFSKISPSVDPNKIGSTTPVIPPIQRTVPISTYTEPITQTQAYTQSQADAQKAEQEYQQKLDQAKNLSNDYTTLLSQVGGKAQDTANAYQIGGVNTAYNRIQDINAQMTALNNSNQAIPIQNQINYQGTAGTQAGVESVNRDQLAQNALKALSLGQEAAIAEGNYNKAKNLADQQVAIKYAQKDAEITSAKAQLEALNNYVLTPAQEKAKEARERAIKLQEQELEKQKDDEKAVGGILTKVATYRDLNNNPAPQSVLDAIKNTKDPMTAVLLAVPYMTDPLERKKKLAEIAQIKAKATGTGTSIKNIPNDALIAAINNGTIDPNKVNSRTIGIMNTLANASVDAVASSAGSQTRTAAVKKIGDQIAQTRRLVTVLDKNMPLLYDLADSANITSIPGIDMIITGARKYTGNNPEVIRYVNTLKTVRAEYAQMLARGGEVTESTRQEAKDAIPAGLSGQGYRELGNQLQLEAQNIIDAGTETYQATLKGNIPTTHQGYSLPPTTTGSGSYKGYILPN